MRTYEYGNLDAQTVLIQPVDDHELPLMEKEWQEIRNLTDKDVLLIAVKVNSWNDDLSPWEAPAVFGKDGCGGRAEKMLEIIRQLCQENSNSYYLGGYSLAGLFALWAGYQVQFAGIAAASPSMWFPGFTDYMEQNSPLTDNIYLSLGDKEEKARNKNMSTVGDCMRQGFKKLQEDGINCTLEWNQGNHFHEPEKRMAKAFAWAVKY